MRKKITRSIIPLALVSGAALSPLPSAMAQPTVPEVTTDSIITAINNSGVPEAPELVRAVEQAASTIRETENQSRERYQPIEDYVQSLDDIVIEAPEITIDNSGGSSTPSIKIPKPKANATTIPYTEGHNKLMTDIVNEALKWQGTPYVWGGESPSEGGFDCSGLIQWAYKQHGISIPRTTWEQLPATTPVSAGDVRPGDLVFYNNTGHVALAISATEVVHAPQTGDVVRIAPLNMMNVENIGRFVT